MMYDKALEFEDDGSPFVDAEDDEEEVKFTEEELKYLNSQDDVRRLKDEIYMMQEKAWSIEDSEEYVLADDYVDPLKHMKEELQKLMLRKLEERSQFDGEDYDEDDYDPKWDRIPVPNATAFDDGYPADDDDNDRDFIDPPCEDDEPKPKKKLTPEEREAYIKKLELEHLEDELPF